MLHHSLRLTSYELQESYGTTGFKENRQCSNGGWKLAMIHEEFVSHCTNIMWRNTQRKFSGDKLQLVGILLFRIKSCIPSTWLWDLFLHSTLCSLPQTSQRKHSASRFPTHQRHSPNEKNSENIPMINGPKAEFQVCKNGAWLCQRLLSNLVLKGKFDKALLKAPQGACQNQVTMQCVDFSQRI